ncbi:ribosome small subunit-dependent GTPase A [Halopseudomonas oceani]|uniref:ribosome small subunit-dependent GTPase A n=1 Tax=Halopseudomonas oceani TaxID=1708783 RepID=UPI002AA5E467|nr:ribosome small subunit-dependent GTPase A [Halopseudomonas oceani]
MTTSKPKQAALHKLAHDCRTADTRGDSGCSAPIACDRHKDLSPPEKYCRQGESIARLTAVDRDQYTVRNSEKEVPAKLTGKAIHSSASSVGLPCVGDWVNVRYHDSGAHASILEVLPRKSFLRRRKPGAKAEFQMIAVNIDLAFIVQSCHVDFNVRRLERYLVITSEGGIEPVILLTKSDLVSPVELEQLISRIRDAGISAKVIALSNVSGNGVDLVRELIEPGKTYCLLGSSGVGKTTLINCLVGGSELTTSAVSSSGEGRHTTTRRQLIVLEQGGSLIDMPGMRELGMLGVGEGIDDSFSDIQAYSHECRFANCTHTSEPGCAIREGIANGELDPEHFQNYLKLKKESEFHEMSNLERRRKDRAFGKFVRSVKKGKGRQDRH